jgi:hypothetical protein
MSRKTLQVTFVTLILVITVSFTLTLVISGKRALPQLNVAEQGEHERWELLFFKSLEPYTKKTRMMSLKTVRLPNKDDLEARFWIDGLPRTIDCVVFRRISNDWSAVNIHGTAEQPNVSITQTPLAEPKSGWNIAWDRLVNAGILTLPDATEVNCNEIGIDGVGFVVEISFNHKYRNYYYRNPQRAGCNEAKQIIAISQIIFDEFML